MTDKLKDAIKEALELIDVHDGWLSEDSFKVLVDYVRFVEDLKE